MLYIYIYIVFWFVIGFTFLIILLLFKARSKDNSDAQAQQCLNRRIIYKATKNQKNELLKESSQKTTMFNENTGEPIPQIINLDLEAENTSTQVYIYIYINMCRMLYYVLF